MEAATTSGKKIFAFVILTLGCVAAGIWLIVRFAAAEAEQDMQSWKARLGLVADSRAAEVSTWLNRHLATVEELAADASISLYASQLANPENQAIAEGQRGYVFSLLSSEAERSGFHEQRAIDTVAANVKRPRRAGLAVIDSDGMMSVLTTGMPLLRPEEIVTSDQQSFIALGPMLADKTPLVLFGARIAATIDDPISTGGNWVIGARPLDGDFLQTLVQPGEQSTTAETYLVVPGDHLIVTPLTPLVGGGKIAEPRQDAAAAFAASNPGGFDILPAYDDQPVLVTGKELSAPVPWVLVRTIRAKEILSEISARRNSLITTLSLLGLFVLAAIIIAWRHGVSKRLVTSYRQQEALLSRNQALSSFLQSVSDSQPAAIAALESDMTVRFTNKQMAQVTGIPTAELADRRLDTAFTSAVSDMLRERVSKAANGTASDLQIRLKSADSSRTYQTQVLPLETGGGDTSASVLVVMQDISDLMAAQAKSETLYRQLVGTLMEIIDARDPWSKHHSSRVADVAFAIAEEVGISGETLEAIEIAAQLVNVGKIFVPTEILTKQTPLSNDELSLVRDSMQKGTSLIAGLDFKGPVAEMLAQMREHWDGSGEPKGIQGDAINPGARILSVANAFVGMVSARAHRAGLGFDMAVDILQKDAGKRYERKAVAALQNILENREGRQRWLHYMDKPEETNI